MHLSVSISFPVQHKNLCFLDCRIFSLSLKALSAMLFPPLLTLSDEPCEQLGLFRECAVFWNFTLWTRWLFKCRRESAKKQIQGVTNKKLEKDGLAPGYF